MAYRAADNPDRVKALGGVLVVHAALAAVILSGLDVAAGRAHGRSAEDLRHPRSRRRRRNRRRRRQVSERARDEEGAAGKKALPTPVVAPQPKIVVPDKPPVVAAPVAVDRQRRDRRCGHRRAAAPARADRAAGSAAAAAAIIRGSRRRGCSTRSRTANIAAFRGGRIPRGSAAIKFRVNADGRMTNCRIVRSSGDPIVDGIVCDAATRYLRFMPARDPDGRAIAQDMTYTPTLAAQLLIESWPPSGWRRECAGRARRGPRNKRSTTRSGPPSNT